MTLTKLQRKALKRAWLRLENGTTYRAFRRSVHPGPGCIMVQFCNMMQPGIEPDGYTHS